MLHLNSLAMSYVVAGRLLLLAYAVDQMQKAGVTYILYFLTAFSLTKNTWKATALFHLKIWLA